MRNQKRKPVLFTIGHSNRSEDELLDMLRSFGIQILIDIRTIPKSRAHPQFWGSHLKEVLRKKRIQYRHLAALGGLRKPQPDSPNTGWRNKSFQGYADHMRTEAFQEGLRKLLELAAKKRVAIMCAEAVPWRCHRNLVADALTVRGFAVEHIMSELKSNPHRLTAWARVRKGRLVYPPEAPVSAEPGPVERAA